MKEDKVRENLGNQWLSTHLLFICLSIHHNNIELIAPEYIQNIGSGRGSDKTNGTCLFTVCSMSLNQSSAVLLITNILLRSRVRRT